MRARVLLAGVIFALVVGGALEAGSTAAQDRCTESRAAGYGIRWEDSDGELPIWKNMALAQSFTPAYSISLSRISLALRWREYVRRPLGESGGRPPAVTIAVTVHEDVSGAPGPEIAHATTSPDMGADFFNVVFDADVRAPPRAISPPPRAPLPPRSTPRPSVVPPASPPFQTEEARGTGVVLIGGQRYFIVVTSPDSDGAFFWLSSGGNPYPDGSAYAPAESVGPESGVDHIFAVWGCPTVSAAATLTAVVPGGLVAPPAARLPVRSGSPQPGGLVLRAMLREAIPGIVTRGLLAVVVGAAGLAACTALALWLTPRGSVGRASTSAVVIAMAGCSYVALIAGVHLVVFAALVAAGILAILPLALIALPYLSSTWRFWFYLHRLVWPRRPMPPGVGIFPEEEPRLFVFLEGSCDLQRVAGYRGVWMTDDFEVTLHESRPLGWFGPTSRVLLLGLPVLDILTTEELGILVRRLVLMAELPGHGVIRWLSDVADAWTDALHELEARGDWSAHLFGRLYVWGWQALQRRLGVMIGNHAAHADRILADEVGRQPLARAILKQRVGLVAVGRGYWPRILEELPRVSEPPTMPTRDVAVFLRESWSNGTAIRWARRLLDEGSSIDFAPLLRGELGKLAVSDDAMPGLLGAPAEKPDAASRLMVDEATLGQRLDRALQARVGPLWAELHAQAEPAVHRLAELERAAIFAPLSESERMEQAGLILMCRGRDDAMAAYRELSARFPSNAYVWYQLGTLLFETNGPEAVQAMERAIELEEPLGVMGGWEQIAAYYIGEGDEARARGYDRRIAFTMGIGKAELRHLSSANPRPGVGELSFPLALLTWTAALVATVASGLYLLTVATFVVGCLMAYAAIATRVDGRTLQWLMVAYGVLLTALGLFTIVAYQPMLPPAGVWSDEQERYAGILLAVYFYACWVGLWLPILRNKLRDRMARNGTRFEGGIGDPIK